MLLICSFIEYVHVLTACTCTYQYQCETFLIFATAHHALDNGHVCTTH